MLCVDYEVDDHPWLAPEPNHLIRITVRFLNIFGDSTPARNEMTSALTLNRGIPSDGFVGHRDLPKPTPLRPKPVGS